MSTSADNVSVRFSFWECVTWFHDRAARSRLVIPASSMVLGVFFFFQILCYSMLVPSSISARKHNFKLNSRDFGDCRALSGLGI